MGPIGSRAVVYFACAVACALSILPYVSTGLANKASPAFEPVLTAEARSRALCESVANRILVLSITGSECIAYFVTSGAERSRRAVLFFDGDASGDPQGHTTDPGKALESRRSLLQHWADSLGVRYVYVSRVGLNGSSGNHTDRRRPHETMIMNVAADLLKARLGLDSLVLAGQSGGSTIAASMLTLGRRDVVCAVLGSGAFELVDLEYKRLKAAQKDIKRDDMAFGMYDPSDNIAGVPKDPIRRIFVLGDKSDKKTPFNQQKRFVESLDGAGHHAVLISIDGHGDSDHAAAHATVPAAGACARGDHDEKIVQMMQPSRPGVLTASSTGE